jgi:Uncharacterized protein conserved in archaea
MQEYQIKRGFTKDLRKNVLEQMKLCFGSEIQENGDHCQTSFGALKILDVVTGKDGKSIIVRTESNIDADDETILDTNRRFRKYLDAVTGYSTKERVKKAKSVE